MLTVNCKEDVFILGRIIHNITPAYILNIKKHIFMIVSKILKNINYSVFD
jgi:hypothetical protein